MQKQKIVTGLFIAVLLVGMIGIMAYQQDRIRQLEFGDIIPINSSISDKNDWGATVYMLIYRSGFLLSEEVHHNVICNAARSALRGHIANSVLAVWKYMAIGTGSGGDASSTTLVSEYSRYEGDYATVGSYNFTLTFTWTEGNFSGQTITEFGVFNDPSTGTILDYNDDFTRGPLQSTDTLQVIANFQIGS